MSSCPLGVLLSPLSVLLSPWCPPVSLGVLLSPWCPPVPFGCPHIPLDVLTSPFPHPQHPLDVPTPLRPTHPFPYPCHPTALPHPLTSLLGPLTSLLGPLCPQDLLQKYSYIRKTRPDGNCFYRAFGFAHLEALLEDSQELQRWVLLSPHPPPPQCPPPPHVPKAQCPPLLSHSFKEISARSKDELVAQGFTEFTIEDFHNTVGTPGGGGGRWGCGVGGCVAAAWPHLWGVPVSP